MLASVFVAGGARTLRNPERAAPAAEPLAAPVASRISWLPEDPEKLVRINGAVQLGAGLMLATGRVPRVAALALAGALVPTTLAGHAWWKEKDPEQRAAQRTQFIKNVSLLGGLLIAAADTHGKPSVAYRTRAAAVTGRRTARRARRDAVEALSGAAEGAVGTVRSMSGSAQQAVTRHL